MRISLENVSYTHGAETVLSGLTCTFTTGMTYVIGRNGAGKSSLLKLLTSTVPPSGGEILYTRLVQHPAQGTFRKPLSVREVRTLTGYLPQHFTGYPEMTVDRFLHYCAVQQGIPRARIGPRLDELLHGSGLERARRKKLASLSGGQLQSVGILQALLHYPRLLVLDEPFEGLDLQETLYLRNQLRRLSFHAAVIVSTHQIEAFDETDEVLVLEDGRLVQNGPARLLGDLQRFF
jgi:ABC-2 type transport system ATP-binding protein